LLYSVQDSKDHLHYLNIYKNVVEILE